MFVVEGLTGGNRLFINFRGVLQLPGGSRCIAGLVAFMGGDDIYYPETCHNPGAEQCNSELLLFHYQLAQFFILERYAVEELYERLRNKHINMKNINLSLSRL